MQTKAPGEMTGRVVRGFNHLNRFASFGLPHQPLHAALRDLMPRLWIELAVKSVTRLGTSMKCTPALPIHEDQLVRTPYMVGDEVGHRASFRVDLVDNIRVEISIVASVGSGPPGT